MGYKVKKNSYKNGPGWKVQMVTYDNKSTKGLKYRAKYKDIPKQDWVQHGFNSNMNVDQAKEVARSLNAQAEVKRWSETKVKIRERLEKENTIESAFLPQVLVEEFEQKILFAKIARGSNDVKFKNKVESHWRTVKKIIREVALPPKEWNESDFLFFNLFVERQMSPSYVQKVLRLLNEWGFFLSRREEKPFLPIPAPRGAQAQRIADAYFDKTPNGEGQASDPLTPEMLEKQKSHLLEENYNWLFLSVWFGLRPFEIDGLKNSNNWKLDNNGRRALLRVYQPKLITVPRADRWKVIPVKYPQQERAVSIIKTGQFRRPIYKVMHRWFGEGVTLYGGRKNFTDMMLDKNEKLEQISLWLGHRNIDRTWRDYKDRQKTDYGDDDAA